MPDYDSELMLRAAEGSDDAFRELFERHYRRAVNIAYRFLGDADLAEDAAMEAFAGVFRTRSSYQPSARFTTYLYKVVVNHCINMARRPSAAVHEPLDEATVEAPPDADPATAAHRRELARAVRDAVLALPTNQRIAIILTRYENLSYESAAQVMNMSVGAVESLLHRAKRRLRKSLAAFFEPE